MNYKSTLLLAGMLPFAGVMAVEPDDNYLAESASENAEQSGDSAETSSDGDDAPKVADISTDLALRTDDIYLGENMIITTGHKLFPNTTIATPSFEITEEEINKTNLISPSDAIKHAPSVHVRRRFYGDTNGVTAIRGSTNFQTNHFNMYVDGLPLHNPVQTSFNGAPKWNLIAPNAIHSATVFYGPYSAEHRGAFGGTFDLKTKLPEKFEVYMDVTGIIQDSTRFGQDEVFTGHKEFISAGNRIGDWTFYGFFNHLENEGQPQSFAFTANPTRTNAGLSVTGGAFTKTEFGERSIISGDDGINEVITDLYEFKASYDFNEDLRALFTIAFEDTERNSQSRSYIRDAMGNTIFGGTVNQNGFDIDINPTSFGSPTLTGRENERKTLAYGLNLSGKINDEWSIDTTASFFDAFKDETLQSNRSRNDPAFRTDQSGRIRDVEVYWVDYSIRLATQSFLGRDDLGFMFGYQFNHSSLGINTYSSNFVYSGVRGALTDDDGGDTQTHSAFMQADWDITDYVNLMAGFRYDNWESSNGRINNQVGGGELDNRDASRISPKASLSITPTDLLSMRYSFSKAYRFPVAQELFDSSRTLGAANISDPNLDPESGYFHDFQIQYELDQGYARATFFYNMIEDEILNTQTLFAGGSVLNRTRGIDETETIGLELVYKQDYIMELPIDLSLNGTWINKIIKEDTNNPALVGKQWVRIPKWRANGTLTYHAMPNWDAIVTVAYRSNAFGDADNSDTASNVFGAIDEYVLVNFKTTYQLDVDCIDHDMKAKFTVGVDNILDEDYYDHHPYPRRTYFANVSLDI